MIEKIQTDQPLIVGIVNQVRASARVMWDQDTAAGEKKENQNQEQKTNGN